MKQLLLDVGKHLLHNRVIYWWETQAENRLPSNWSLSNKWFQSIDDMSILSSSSSAPVHDIFAFISLLMIIKWLVVNMMWSVGVFNATITVAYDSSGKKKREREKGKKKHFLFSETRERKDFLATILVYQLILSIVEIKSYLMKDQDWPNHSNIDSIYF